MLKQIKVKPRPNNKRSTKFETASDEIRTLVHNKFVWSPNMLIKKLYNFRMEKEEFIHHKLAFLQELPYCFFEAWTGLHQINLPPIIKIKKMCLEVMNTNPNLECF